MVTRRSNTVLRALADPVRCRLLELLGRRPASVNELASRFPVSRPAISRHLRLLREAGLVREERRGRRRVYRLETAPLAGLADWLDTLGIRAAPTGAAQRGRAPVAPPGSDDVQWRVW